MLGGDWLLLVGYGVHYKTHLEGLGGLSNSPFVFFSMFILLLPISGCGSLVKTTGRLYAINFQGPSLANCFWLRTGFAFGSMKTMLQVKGA